MEDAETFTHRAIRGFKQTLHSLPFWRVFYGDALVLMRTSNCLEQPFLPNNDRRILFLATLK
jgi:hypothetical protein